MLNYCFYFFLLKIGYGQVVKKLIENGAVVNIIDKSGISPLHHAASGGHLSKN